MSRKYLVLPIIAAVFLSAVSASAAQAKVAARTAGKAKTAAVKQTVKPTVKPVAVPMIDVRKPVVEAAPAVQVVKAEDQSESADVREDMNKAVAELKGQIDKVKADNSDAKLGALIFFRWQKYTANGGTHVNNFDVDRAYIDIKKKLDRNASARMTLDVARITGSARQNLFDYLKYAYVEAPVALPALLQPLPWELTAKIGLQHTVWIDWADKQLGLRYIAKSLLDNEGVMSSADFGVGAIGKISLPYVSDIEYHVTALNGTGYATNESDSKKAVAIRLNSTVFENENAGKVMVGLFSNVESMKADFTSNGSGKQGGLAVSYQHELGRAYFENVTGSKGGKDFSGYSLGGVLNLPQILPGSSVFYRVDQYDANTAAANDEKNKTFYGAMYNWGKDVKFAVDMQNSWTGSGTVTSILYLHSMIQL